MIESVANKNAWKRRLFVGLAAALVAVSLSSCAQEGSSSGEQSSSSVSISDSEPPVSDVSKPSSESGGLTDRSEAPPELVEASDADEASRMADGKAVKEYDYSSPVPAGEAVDDSYFDDAVFIGDSRTQGFILYNNLSNATAYVDKGLKVDTAFTKADIEVDGVQMSAMDALAQNTGFQKVYVMLGVNELGWAYSDIFIEKYGELVDKIKEIKPDAEIYIQSILPVSEEKSNQDQIYNMTKINEYNGLIQEMAQEKEVYYLNVAEAVADSEGYLPQEASTDGVHLNKSYCAKWLDYLKCHTVENMGQ